MEDQSIHIVGEICRGQYHVGPLDLDGSNEQAIAVLLVCKNMVDAGADRGLFGVRMCGGFGIGLPAGYDGDIQMTDSTSVRIHQHAANSKK